MLRKNYFKILVVLITLITSSYLIYNNLISTHSKTLSQDKNDDNDVKNNEYLQSSQNNPESLSKNFSENVSDSKDSIGIGLTENSNAFKSANLVNDNRGVPVLYYHSVNTSDGNELIISPDKLRTQLEYIKNKGYITLTINQLKDYLINNAPIPEHSILITFDDGYMDNYSNAFSILKDLHMVATVFCIASDLDGSYFLSKEAIKEMSDYGIDIESHTVTHPKLNELNYEDQLNELTNSKKILEDITGKEIIAVAYPYGDFNDDSIKATQNSGYTLAFTTKLGFADRNDNIFKLDRIYINSNYTMDTFKEVLNSKK